LNIHGRWYFNYVIDGEVNVVTLDGDKDESVILKIPFIPPLPFIDLLADF
jgi:hypothetical protein